MAVKHVTWRGLIPGLAATGGIVAIVLAILIFGRVGALHGKTIPMFVATAEARGIITGSDVWLEGQRVGKVSSIQFRTLHPDSAALILIGIDVLAKYREHIRTDSHAQIRSAGTLIGEPVIYVTAGSTAGTALQARDTIRAKSQADFEGVTSQLAIASRHFPPIIENIKAMNAGLKSARGTLGALGMDENRREIDVLKTRAANLADRALQSDGTIAMSLREGQLMTRARTVMARADSVKTVMTGATTRLGRFTRDTTMTATIADIRNEVSIVRGQLAAAEGTAGRILGDSAVFMELARLERELGALMADVKRNPMRYVNF